MQIQKTNTILYCHLWTETVAFYREIFAFPITYENDWFVEFQLTADSFLSIADERRATIHSVTGQGITLSWQVPDVRQMHAALEQQQIEVSAIRRKWGADVLYLHDPEGHRIELWQPAPS